MRQLKKTLPKKKMEQLNQFGENIYLVYSQNRTFITKINKTKLFAHYIYSNLLVCSYIPIGKSNIKINYEIKGSTIDKVFYAFGAISAIMLSNNPGMLPEIQVTLSHFLFQSVLLNLSYFYF